MERIPFTMDGSTSHCKRLLVAAFDIGTTFSGYAFSFRDNPMSIKANQSWAAGSQQLLSLKTPTCVLLKPNKEFHSFGFEAENKYNDLAEDDEHQGWYLFRRFKMMLYDTKNLHMETSVEDIAGKKMPALTIFGHVIRYLNSHLLQTLNKQTIGIQPEDIQYIITVPAIWDQKAKQFMRKAANEGGIKDDQLQIALEPEAASIWCQVATEDKLTGLANPGSKYMVVDLGGGTADITIHEKMADGTLKELHKVTGGSWGGVQVDNAYEDMLSEVFGDGSMMKFKANHVGEYFELMRDFENKKRTITIDTEGKMTFKIPVELKKCIDLGNETIENLIEKSRYKGKMKFVNDKLRVEKVIVRSFFDTAIAKLSHHIEELFSSPVVSKVDTVLLVGGFGECEVVREALEKKFTNKKLMIPEEAGLAILKGSVRFGHLPEIVSVRISRFTYGIRTCPMFNKRLHDQTRKVIIDGFERCRDVFDIMVKSGEEIPCGREIQRIGRPVAASQKRFSMNIYSSMLENPKYVTDEDCALFGKIIVDLPESDTIDDKKHNVYITFGSTELKVRVLMIKTNETHETVIDCFE